jgi:hypothetical protein
MKKFSLLTNDQIRKHLANTSPAKVTHSFSKTRRFFNSNPEYLTPHPDAKRPSMAALPLFPTATAASDSANAQISRIIPSYLLDHPHINKDLNSIN